jgi:TPR repeat protein
MRSNILAVTCLLLMSAPAIADEWLDALVAFNDERYEDALALLLPLGQAGNLKAQEMLYDMYKHGHGVQADPQAAFNWMLRSALQGDARAEEAVGRSYLYGTGVTADETLALHWFTRSAFQNNAAAIYNIGVLTMNGQGVAPNAQEAVQLFQQAAGLNNPDALYVLGGMYLEGTYVDPDGERALDYLSKAASLGQRRAMALLGVIFEELTDDPDYLVKSAFHLKTAVSAGCDDIGKPVAQAMARLSPAQVKSLDYNLALWQPESDPRDDVEPPGHCLSQ